MRNMIALACWMFVAAAAVRHGAQGANIGANIADFIDYTLRDAGGQVLLPGRLFVPPEASSGENTSRPLMMSLHGADASGSDNVTQIARLPDYIVDEAKRRGAFLYIPQTQFDWSNVAVDRAMTMIDRAVAERNVDASRLYAMGYSNGGGGTWNLLNHNPNRFAAAIPVAGVEPSVGFLASNLLGTPIFALHARDDDIVPVSRTRNVVSGILSAAGEPAPNYALAGTGQSFLVSNPHIEFHQALVASQEPGSTINYFISGHDLDLLYLETPDGGHSVGPLEAFCSPFTYEWMFSHSRAVHFLAPTEIYTVIDNDTDGVFDDLGDTAQDVSGEDQRPVGEADGPASNRIVRLVAKFALPDPSDPLHTLKSATLRFFLEDIVGNPTGAVSVFHSIGDNDMDLLSSDYEDPGYEDSLLDMVAPTDAVGRYYEVNVTDLVRADYAADGAFATSAFRLQISELEFVEDDQEGRYIFRMPGSEGNHPELELTFVPEPTSLVLAFTGLLGLAIKRRRRRFFGRSQKRLKTYTT